MHLVGSLYYIDLRCTETQTKSFGLVLNYNVKNSLFLVQYHKYVVRYPSDFNCFGLFSAVLRSLHVIYHINVTAESVWWSQHVCVMMLKRNIVNLTVDCCGRHLAKTVWLSLWIKPTDALNSNFIGITTLRVLGSLSAHHQEFLTVHQHWYILCSFEDRCYQFDDRLLPGARWNHRAPGSKRSSTLYKMYQCRCTARKSWWWAERLPETCRVVIPIKLEFSASVGFIHKEFVTMHGHTILKKTFDVICINDRSRISSNDAISKILNQEFATKLVELLLSVYWLHRHNSVCNSNDYPKSLT